MAITVDWVTRIINVPKADTQLVQSVPTEIRQLDLDIFRKDLNALQADEEGIPFLTTHQHVQPIDIGGVTLARVIEIINGYTVTFEDGQYAVNLVGANSNVGDVTNVNQVSIRSANSAGLTFSEQINDQSFQGHIWIDVPNGLSGTDFPRGTVTDPVSNWPDAAVIGDSRNIRAYNLVGSITPDSALTSRIIVAESPILAAVTLSGAVDTTGAVFKHVTVGGTVLGTSVYEGCIVLDMDDFSGALTESGICATVTVASGSTNQIRIVNCYSDVAGTTRPVLDVNGAAVDIIIRNYVGGLTIENFTSASNSISFDGDPATVELAATCTAGTAKIGGVTELIDNSTMTVDVERTVSELAAAGSITEGDKDDIANRIIPQIWAAAD